ncbi:MAG TPA: outer membrane beta-barrel protein [Bacteroidia bacterium]|nr:outer membrane beta-barrel protein [Bacteroidia bacterium]
MKKNTILKIVATSVTILFCQATNNPAIAQGAYVTAGMGYNLAAGSMVIGYNTTENGFTGISQTAVSGSLGKGISFGAGFGYMFSKNVGAELGFSYLSGSTYKFTYTHIEDFSGESFTSTSKIKGKMIRLTPAIKITAGEKLRPYVKFGVVIGILPKAEEEGSSTDLIFGLNSTDKYSGGTSIGWMGALGLDFNLSSMFSIFLEVSTINQSWSPGKDEYTRPDIDYSNGYPIPVVKSGTTTYVETDTGKPDEQSKGYIPFSSLGVHTGIKISFGGEAAAAK